MQTKKSKFPRHRFNNARKKITPQKQSSFTVRQVGQKKNLPADLSPIALARGGVYRRETKAGTKLRLIPLGGLEGIGKNCTVIEYKNDLIIADLGLQFPDEDMPGVDYVIPDTTYLQKNRDKIRGIIVTHGHLDHTGAIPYIIKKIGNPPIFGTRLTCGLIRQRLEEFKLEKYVKLNTIHPDDILQIGSFRVSFFRVNHNIPDGVGLAVQTPLGVIVHTGDFKFDAHPVDDKPAEFKKIKALGKSGVLLLLSDSTNAENPGQTMSEKVIGESIEKIFAEARGRIIFTTFSNLSSRIQQVINSAEKYNRKVAVSGLSMEKAIEVTVRLGYLRFPKKLFVKLDKINNFKNNQIVILSTGSQGQEMSALARMTRGEHRQIQIQKGDTIVLSSSPIPGNERAIQNIMNRLVDAGAEVVYNKNLDIHTSGHANQEDLKKMLEMVRPKFFVPIHSDHFKQHWHKKLALEQKIPEKNIFILFNGSVLEIDAQGQAALAPEKIPASNIMVDGLGIGDVGNVVLRDRQMMAQDGMLVVIVAIDKDRQLVNSPDIISRGFVYMKSSTQLMKETKDKVTKIVKNHTANQGKEINWSPLRARIRDDIGQFLFYKTERRPMILPVVIEV